MTFTKNLIRKIPSRTAFVAGLLRARLAARRCPNSRARTPALRSAAVPAASSRGVLAPRSFELDLIAVSGYGLCNQSSCWDRPCVGRSLPWLFFFALLISLPLHAAPKKDSSAIAIGKE